MGTIRLAGIALMLLMTCATGDAATITVTSIQTVRIGDAHVIPNGVVTAPKVLVFHPAAYTATAAAQRVEGLVTVEAAVDTDGRVSVLRIINGLGFGLDESAIAALQTWRFSPADRNSVPVPVIARIDVEFRQLLQQEIHNRLDELTQKVQQKQRRVDERSR
jgi:TonB family protein